MAIEPILRHDYEKALRKVLDVLTSKEYPESPVKSCINCVHFLEQNYWCRKFNLVPPARVIAYSCGEEGYLDNDDIPF
jgi:hypothetical protein